MYTIHQLKGCGIGFFRCLAITSRTPFMVVLNRASTISTILFIHTSYLQVPILFWNFFIDLLDNCSTGYGQRFSKYNLTNLLNIGITTKSANSQKTKHVRLNPKTCIHGSSSSCSTVWNYSWQSSNQCTPCPDSHLMWGINVLGWWWIQGCSKGGIPPVREPPLDDILSGWGIFVSIASTINVASSAS